MNLDRFLNDRSPQRTRYAQYAAIAVLAFGAILLGVHLALANLAR